MRRILDKSRTCLKIRELCYKKNVSVTRLTNELDVSTQTVYSWLSGKKLPSIDHLVELSDLLEASISDLVVTREYYEDCDERTA